MKIRNHERHEEKSISKLNTIERIMRSVDKMFNLASASNPVRCVSRRLVFKSPQVKYSNDSSFAFTQDNTIARTAIREEEPHLDNGFKCKFMYINSN